MVTMSPDIRRIEQAKTGPCDGCDREAALKLFMGRGLCPICHSKVERAWDGKRTIEDILGAKKG